MSGSSCDPCKPCGPAPHHRVSPETVTPTRYRIVAQSGAIVAATGAQVVVSFPCAGRIYGVRGAVNALGGHASLDAALMSIRAGWSKNASDPSVRQNDGLAAGDASLLGLFGRDLSVRDPLAQDGGDGLCIGADDKVMVRFEDANGGDTAEAELVFYFEPKG